MGQFNKVDTKFQCKFHDLRNDKDWVNFKRSMVRTPQILKQAFNAGSQMEKDQIFDTFWAKFQSIYNQLEDLQGYIIDYNNHIRNYLDHMKRMGVAFKKIFDPKLSKFGNDGIKDGLNTLAEEFEGMAIDDRIQEGLAVKFSSKIEEIIQRVTPNLDCIMENVKEPLKKMILIFDHVKQNETERIYAILDVNKYLDNLASLQKRQRETILTLKQEQNLVKYKKDLELAQFKFDQINDQFKRELPLTFASTQKFIKPAVTIFFFLQLTINYHLLGLNEIQDSFFKLGTKSATLPGRQFFVQLAENYHKNHDAVKEKLAMLDITRSQDEIKVLRLKLDSQVLKGSQSIRSRKVEISAAGSTRSLIKVCVADYDYTLEEDGDLSFKKWDKIRILDQKFNENWWKGELKGVVGIFPKNYVTLE